MTLNWISYYSGTFCTGTLSSDVCYVLSTDVYSRYTFVEKVWINDQGEWWLSPIDRDQHIKRRREDVIQYITVRTDF